MGYHQARFNKNLCALNLAYLRTRFCYILSYFKKRFIALYRISDFEQKDNPYLFCIGVAVAIDMMRVKEKAGRESAPTAGVMGGNMTCFILQDAQRE